MDERRERLQEIAEGKSSAPRLGSSSTALFFWKKWVSGYPLDLDVIGKERRQFLPDVPVSLW